MTQHRIPVVAPYAMRCGGLPPWGGGAEPADDAPMWVCSLSGHDELAVADSLGARSSAVDIVSAILGTCVMNDAGPIGTAAAEAFSIGDREVLLRAVYAATFGAMVEAQIDCQAGCGEEIAFSIDLGDLVQVPPEAGPVHHVWLGGLEVSCRVPTGADLKHALSRPGAGLDFLVQACTAGEAQAAGDLDAALAYLDPNAECALTLECPQCGGTSLVWLDAFDLLRRRIAEQGGIMFSVDLLARNYGWNEAEILALPRDRRWRYCSMLAADAAR